MKCRFLFCNEWYDGPVKAIGFFRGSESPLVLACVDESYVYEHRGRVYAGHAIKKELLSELLYDARIIKVIDTTQGTSIIIDDNEKIAAEFRREHDYLYFARVLEAQIDGCVPVAAVLGIATVETPVSAAQAERINAAFIEQLESSQAE